jgi:hypothetical protein
MARVRNRPFSRRIVSHPSSAVDRLPADLQSPAPFFNLVEGRGAPPGRRPAAGDALPVLAPEHERGLLHRRNDDHAVRPLPDISGDVSHVPKHAGGILHALLFALADRGLGNTNRGEREDH